MCRWRRWGGWKDDGWKWGDLGIPDSVEEEPDLLDQLNILKGRLESFDGWKEGKDSVVWLGTSDRTFSVASCYDMYEKSRLYFGPPNKDAEAFGLLWESVIPFKIKAFGWRLFHDRLPTKDMLVVRGLSFSLDEVKCKFCGNILETRDHLFFGCLVVKNIWSAIAFWVGKGDYFEEGCLANFMDWHSFFHRSSVEKLKLDIVWFATIWCIWGMRNAICFRQEQWNVNNTVWNIKLMVWRWSFCGNVKHSKYSFYEFCKEPLFFLS